MKISGIYKIQSISHPDRCYIGSSVNIHKRWLVHLRELRLNIHICSKLQRHYNKYGKDDLKFSVIIGCGRNDLISTEQFFLDSTNPYFNTCKKAGNTLWVKLSDETKKKLSNLKKGKSSWNKGKKLSEDHKRKIAKAQLGENNSFYHKKHSSKTIDKIIEWNKNNPPSKEARRKQAESLRRHYENQKLIKQFNVN